MTRKSSGLLSLFRFRSGTVLDLEPRTGPVRCLGTGLVFLAKTSDGSCLSNASFGRKNQMLPSLSRTATLGCRALARRGHLAQTPRLGLRAALQPRQQPSSSQAIPQFTYSESGEVKEPPPGIEPAAQGPQALIQNMAKASMRAQEAYTCIILRRCQCPLAPLEVPRVQPCRQAEDRIYRG